MAKKLSTLRIKKAKRRKTVRQSKKKGGFTGEDNSEYLSVKKRAKLFEEAIEKKRRQNQNLKPEDAIKQYNNEYKKTGEELLNPPI